MILTKKWNDNFYDMETKVETPVRDRDDILFDSIIWHLRNSVNNGKQYLSGGDCEAYFRELVKKVKVNDMESCKGIEFEDIKKIAYLSINDKDYADEIEVNLGDDYEYKFEMNRLYILKKKPKYPTTYEECWKVRFEVDGETTLEEFHYISGYYSEPLGALQKLLCCRDAYWKIYGEEMGLGKLWEPDLENEELYCIQNFNKQITTSRTNTTFNKILIFPTEEMRDAFYNNFKDLIEQCKTLL